MKLIIASKEQISEVLEKFDSFDQKVIKECLNGDDTIVEIANKYYLGRRTIYRILNKFFKEMETKYGKVHL